MTPNAQVVYDYIKLEYSEITKIGVTNCRKISGSQTYSQHSWSNALDIMTYDRALQDEIAADLRTFGPDVLRNMLTYKYNSAHNSHVHVDFWPKGWLAPPCMEADLRIKYADGTVTTNAPFPLTILEEELITRQDKADEGNPDLKANYTEMMQAGVFSAATQPGGITFNDEFATFLVRFEDYIVEKYKLGSTVVPKPVLLPHDHVLNIKGSVGRVNNVGPDAL